jgi:hypothetical protein
MHRNCFGASLYDTSQPKESVSAPEGGGVFNSDHHHGFENAASFLYHSYVSESLRQMRPG